MRGRGFGKKFVFEVSNIVRKMGVDCVRFASHSGIFDVGFYQHLGLKGHVIRDQFPIKPYAQMLYTVKL